MGGPISTQSLCKHLIVDVLWPCETVQITIAGIDFDSFYEKSLDFRKCSIDFTNKVPPEQKSDLHSSAVYFLLVLCIFVVDTHHNAVFVFFFKICKNVTQHWLQRAVVFCVAAASLVLNEWAGAFFQAIGARWLLFGTSGNATPRRRVGRRFSLFKLKDDKMI